MLTYPGRSSQNLWNKKSGYDETAIKILALDWQLISRALRFDKTREVGLSGRVAEVINESLDTIEPEHLEIVSTVQCLNMFPWEATFWFHRWLTINEFNSFRRLGLNYSKSNWDTRITPERNTVRYDLSRFLQKMFYVSGIAGEVVVATICSALMFRHPGIFRHRQGIHPYQLSLRKVRDAVRIQISVHNLSLKYDNKRRVMTVPLRWVLFARTCTIIDELVWNWRTLCHLGCLLTTLLVQNNDDFHRN